jgi:hypothetical protein
MKSDRKLYFTYFAAYAMFLIKDWYTDTVLTSTEYLSEAINICLTGKLPEYVR